MPRTTSRSWPTASAPSAVRDRALTLVRNAPKDKLSPPLQAELTIVEAGARRDRGELDAALRTLENAPLLSKSREPWVARLRYAYADTLLAAGRPQDALTWFHRTEAVDGEEQHRRGRARRGARASSSSVTLTARQSSEPLSTAYDVAVLDLDGVVYVGPDAVPGAPEALNAAQDGGHAPRLRHQQRRPAPRTWWVTHLRRLGVDAHDEDVVTSAQAAARLLAARARRRAARSS